MIGKDLLAAVQPVAVPVEIDPGIQPVAAGIGVLQVDGQRRLGRRTRVRDERRDKGHAVFVVRIVVVITQGIGIGNTVDFYVTVWPQCRTDLYMSRTVVGTCGRIVADKCAASGLRCCGCVTEVHDDNRRGLRGGVVARINDRLIGPRDRGGVADHVRAHGCGQVCA